MIVTLGGAHEVIPTLWTTYLSNLAAPASSTSFTHIHRHNPNTPTTMSTEWSLDFCLVCDRQTMGAPYCSQTCRLAELDRPTPDDGSRQSAQSHSRSSSLDSTVDLSSTRGLSASSSQTSLTSLRSQSSNSTVADQLQDELRDYASCFDPVRDLKRRLTTS